MFREFTPTLFQTFKSGYSLPFLKKDLIAGITIGVIALPLAMAFAIAAGTTPEKGLITAIVAGFLVAALGGSRYQVSGPTGAFVVLIYDIIQRNGYEGLAISTLIGSLLLVLFGIFKLGRWIKFVPHPLITGFTTGIAVCLFSSQIRDFFGLNIKNLPADFTEKWQCYIHTFPSFNSPALLLGLGTLALIIVIRKFAPKIPWGITSILMATMASTFFELPVETIFTKFGHIPNHIPLPSFPKISIPFEKMEEIVMDGIAIAFLSGVEALLSAVIADGMMGTRHKSNIELVAQGVGNFGSILFGGIPATGAIARTAANVKSGAFSPLASIFHALTLLMIVLCLSSVVSQIPLAALAAVLMMVSWNMSEVHHFFYLFKAPPGDVVVMLAAFFLTIFFDITVAITFGMILASFLFMSRMSRVSKTVPLNKVLEDETPIDEEMVFKKIPQGIEVYEIQGPFYFGVADMLKDLLTNLQKPPQAFILRLKNVPFVDASGIHALKEFYQKCHKEKTTLMLCEISEQTEKDLKKFGMTKLIGKNLIFSTFNESMKVAKKLTIT